VQELTLQQSSSVDVGTLLNFDCEAFPFVFEMGVDNFYIILSVCIFFSPLLKLRASKYVSQIKPNPSFSLGLISSSP
jgi:hypothetical protein